MKENFNLWFKHIEIIIYLTGKLYELTSPSLNHIMRLRQKYQAYICHSLLRSAFFIEDYH